MTFHRYLHLLFAIFFSCVTFFGEAQIAFGKVKLINDEWLFRLKDENRVCLI